MKRAPSRDLFARRVDVPACWPSAAIRYAGEGHAGRHVHPAREEAVDAKARASSSAVSSASRSRFGGGEAQEGRAPLSGGTEDISAAVPPLLVQWRRALHRAKTVVDNFMRRTEGEALHLLVADYAFGWSVENT